MPEHDFWLSDAQFARLQPLLPNKVRGVPRGDDRKVISGIIHVIRYGLRWRDAPAGYGPRKTLYNRDLPSCNGPSARLRPAALRCTGGISRPARLPGTDSAPPLTRGFLGGD